MWMAIFADVGVMVIAVLNAIRALFVKHLWQIAPPPFVSDTKSDSRSADYRKSGILNYRFSQAKALSRQGSESRSGARWKRVEKSMLVDFEYPLPKSCNSKSALAGEH